MKKKTIWWFSIAQRRKYALFPLIYKTPHDLSFHGSFPCMDLLKMFSLSHFLSWPSWLLFICYISDHMSLFQLSFPWPPRSSDAIHSHSTWPHFTVPFLVFNSQQRTSFCTDAWFEESWWEILQPEERQRKFEQHPPRRLFSPPWDVSRLEGNQGCY